MEVINNKSVSGRKISLISIVYIMAMFLFLFISLNILDSRNLMVLVLIISVLPFFFKKRISEYFTKNSVISFTDDKINLKLYDSITNELVEEYNFDFENIKYYSTRDSTKNSKTSFFLLKMKNEKKFGYEFLNNDGDDLTNLINKYIDKFNLTKINQANRIQPFPGFFTTNTGKIAFYILSILAVVDVVVMFITYRKNGFLHILPGIMIYLSILGMRKKAFQRKEGWDKKMKEMNDSIMK